MSHVICVDGLAGNPNVTFNGLKTALEKEGHKVHLMPVNDIVTHQDRVSRVSRVYEQVRADFPNDRHFIIGQSAGGSAVRLAVAKLDKEYQPHGIILLSPAMPRGISFATKPLVRVMLRNVFSLIFRSQIALSDKDYSDLISPLPDDVLSSLSGTQVLISTSEARELAFFPAQYLPISCNCTIIYGDCDRWINPDAQEKSANIMRRKRDLTKFVILTCRIHGAGHFTLFHKETVDCICRSIY